jgi:hypothetical protein
MTTVPRHEDFAPYVGQVFRFDGWHGSLRLSAIERGRSPGVPGLPSAPFTLIFAGPRGDVLAEGLYGTTTEDGTRFAFYIMPVHTPAPDRQEYQAVFN